jgi:ATP-dependent Clp protease ATP-binding subunit ClpA
MRVQLTDGLVIKVNFKKNALIILTSNIGVTEASFWKQWVLMLMRNIMSEDKIKELIEKSFKKKFRPWIP